MRKMIVVLLTLYCFCATVQTISASYSAMSCATRSELESENSHEIQSVASISKVMSAIIALEHTDLDTLVTINERIMEANGSSIYLEVGQIVSMRTLLYGLLLRSGNDAAMAIADYVGGGDMKIFVKYMNEKAFLLGMKNTLFLNPSGLDDHDAGNVSTPYDMSLMMCASLSYPILQEIMSTKTYKTESSQVWSNKNRLLSMYPYSIGGKTGFTKKAGRTLVSGAFFNFPVAITTFRVVNDFAFHKATYEAIYRNYKKYVLVKAGEYYYQKNRYLVEQDLMVIRKTFDPSDVTIVYDKRSKELIVTYQDNSLTQSFRVQGRRN